MLKAQISTRKEILFRTECNKNAINIVLQYIERTKKISKLKPQEIILKKDNNIMSSLFILCYWLFTFKF